MSLEGIQGLHEAEVKREHILGMGECPGKRQGDTEPEFINFDSHSLSRIPNIFYNGF